MNAGGMTGSVGTSAIREAIAGRESLVLDSLGINWRAGRPHITCPYPGHGGAADWRWDVNAAKARCTCATGDSIFDVLMKCEGISFDAAKVRAAELIGRTDLIRNGNDHYQATDAASLLSAPAERRDDRLPLAYLAFRLGVTVDAVPIPSTPVVGLKVLGYFDPPTAGSREKPRLVGEYPCAVFGTVTADGRTHAHRIYVAEGGAGKADLGTGPDGRPRDPKKSAKVVGNENTAGRAVVWGDATRASHIIVAEGIETGAAVALALTPEIEAGTVAVAAAITAGGVEAFQPYPATRRVTIAADRDEALKNGKTGSRRGEKAALEFHRRHHEKLEVAIALPGNPGESVDWLDVLRREGADAVRAGILAAIPFMQPQADNARGNGAWTDEGEPKQQRETGSPPTTEDAIALTFATIHASTLRYVDAWSRWLRWDHRVWAHDETLGVFDLVRRQCREARKALPQDASEKLRAILASAKTVAAVERLAKSDRRLAATVAQWDSDPDILNTPGGLVDLRTGALRPHSSDEYCTKMTTVAPAPPGTDCPLWRAFLDRIMAGDGELIRFLQRVAGYALTGLTVEHALFFLYGTGANGKGVFLNTLTGIFGDYATIAAMETFTASNSERHPTDLAMLRGARLVSAQETEDGRRWAEAKIKSLTGGDPITARFMRQDFFTYVPQFKLLVAGNHKPGLQGVHEAIRRRLNLIPFGVTIPPRERDQRLPEKLKAEWPAILRWAVDGCLEWRRRGLDQPQAVQSATNEYLADEDNFGRWLEECCQRTAFGHETTADLFASWRKYCERTGEHAGTEKRLRENLKQRGFKPKRQGGTGRGGFQGIALNRPDYTDDPRYGD